ncbi:MAG: neutral/alkaline non-lysosomal ceramidase N-terminal domain-containing protein [Myxococcota bacterium]
MEYGFARKDITAFEPGMLMLGWAAPQNRVDGVATRLYARALVVRDPTTGRKAAFCCADLCFITFIIRRGVLAGLDPALEFGPHNVMLTATHTHSGPAGISEFPFYNALNFGFSRVVYDAVVSGIGGAISEANARLRPGRGSLVDVPLAPRIPIAFNRSLAAHNENRDVDPVRDPAKAIDRTMKVLRVDGPEGLRGMVSWFAVHPTNVHSENRLLHSDNKGVAATTMEHRFRARDGVSSDFVALFAQRSLGDVSPNFRWHPARKRRIGIHEDDFRSAEANAELHIEAAREGLELAKRAGVVLRGPIEGRTEHHDLGDIEVDPRFADGKPARRTRRASYGLGMAVGTDEGPGPLYGAHPWIRATARLRRGRRDDPQLPLVQTGLGVEGRLLGLIPNRQGLALGHVDAGIDFLRVTYRRGTIDGRPWTPQVLPLQLLRIGPLAVVGVPAEPTTQAGRRLARDLQAELGLSEVIVNGCANAYVSYVTTFEEYQLQGYEGASTHFGPFTLAAIRTLFRAIAQRDRNLPVDAEVFGTPPLETSLAELDARRVSGEDARRRKRLMSGALSGA